MSQEFFSQISLGGAALLIFALCAGWVIFRGVARMIIGTLVLALSAWVAFQVWQRAPALSAEWLGEPKVWLTTGLPLAAFLVSAFVIRKICRIVTSPFGKPGEGKPPRTLFGTAFRLILALVPTAILWFIGAGFIHHQGSIDEVRAVSETPGETPQPSLSQRLKSAVDSAMPASWLEKIDPLAEPSRLALAKYIAAQSTSKPAPLIDPGTGQPIPRAIIVDEPALQNLAREGNFGTLLRHPLLTQALEDPKVQALLKDLNF